MIELTFSLSVLKTIFPYLLIYRIVKKLGGKKVGRIRTVGSLMEETLVN